MIHRLDAAARAGIDSAIDDAVARIRRRSPELGETFAALADAVTRAAGGGKRFRPSLVVASFEAFGGRPADLSGIYAVAASFELLHTAFVVHDDVIDHDLQRRGTLNIAGEFRARGAARGADASAAADLGDAAAILGGDLLLYEATRLIARAEVPADHRSELLALFDDAVVVSAAGELADVENALGGTDPATDSLIAAAHDKTAVYSFAAPLRAGALLAGAEAHDLDVLRVCGGRLGLAYQLVDDLIGAFGTPDQAGRDAGGDLREAKRTPLIALARQTASWPTVSDALARARTGPVAVLEAQRVLDESGARERLCRLVGDTLTGARAAAGALPDAARGLVDEIAERIGERIP
ncbi:polyprenyl synthetase family protein [Microbacterium sp. 18062]|uniref:polyprenyl synthetase family protein n=1 Tax=Microbacterium sp. 18062 TaxID=2681410 RepID=UPI00135A0947|nr:polyprenyl synthetase family protein [Microbacterium sp. 18062]